MSLSTKILMSLLAVIVICVGGFLIFKQIENDKKLDDIQKSIISQKELLDNIVRAQSQYASKEDIETYAKQQNINLDVIRKDLDTLNASIKAINGIIVVSKGQANTNIPSTNITPRPNPPTVDPKTDPFGYLANTQHLQLNEKFSNIEVPFGTVAFSAWKEKPWDINISERKYFITSVLGQDENGKHYSYSKFAIHVGKKAYDVKIDVNKFLEEYPESKFHLFNFRPSLQFSGGITIGNAIAPNANVGIGTSFISYGRTKNSPNINFVKPVVSYEFVNKELNVGIIPVELNVGYMINSGFIKNTYIGPTIGVGIPSKSINFGMSVGVLF